MSFLKAWIWTPPSPLSSEPRLSIRAAAGCTAPLHPPQGLGWKQRATGQFCYRSPPLLSPLLPLAASERLEQMVGAGGPRARGWEAGPVSIATPSPQASSAAHPIPSPGRRTASLRCRDGHEGTGRREGLGTEGGLWPPAEVSPEQREIPTVGRVTCFSQGLFRREERCAAPALTCLRRTAIACICGGSSGESILLLPSVPLSAVTCWISRWELFLLAEREQRLPAKYDFDLLLGACHLIIDYPLFFAQDSGGIRHTRST